MYIHTPIYIHTHIYIYTHTYEGHLLPDTQRDSERFHTMECIHTRVCVLLCCRSLSREMGRGGRLRETEGGGGRRREALAVRDGGGGYADIHTHTLFPIGMTSTTMQGEYIECHMSQYIPRVYIYINHIYTVYYTAYT